MNKTRGTSGAAFTLIEVVLAIALASVVMYLLLTAIELYLVQVDSSRTRVESAQVARTVLDRIAADLKAARLQSSASSSMGGGSGAADDGTGEDETGANSTGSSIASGTGGADGNAGDGGDLANSNETPKGLNGTKTQLRIDRTAYTDWDRVLRSEESLLQNDAGNASTTVRYYMADGRRMMSQDIAERGIQQDPTTGVSGLYREEAPTASLIESNMTTISNSATAGGRSLSDSAESELLAPEIVSIEFAYFNGQQLLETWDMSQNSSLPAGVEIRLKVMELSYEEALGKSSQARLSDARIGDDDVVEYRRFVQLTPLTPRNTQTKYLLMQQQGQPGSGNADGEGDSGASGPNGQNGAPTGSGGPAAVSGS